MRELIECIIERAVLLCQGREIQNLSDLPENIVAPAKKLAASTARRDEHVRRAASSYEGGTHPLPPEVFEQPLLEVREKVLEKLEREYLTGLLRHSTTRRKMAQWVERRKLAGIEPRGLCAMMK